MTNIQAAFLYQQLQNIHNILKQKRTIFCKYESLLTDLKILDLIKVFSKEENTQSADRIFVLRIINNIHTIESTISFFSELGVEIRPFFYPINSHNHLNDLHVDKCLIPSYLNKQVIFIPSSPNITFDQQLQVIYSIRVFLFHLINLEVIQLSPSNHKHMEQLNEFIV